MAEYTREWKYRAWHPVEKKMYSPEDLEEPDTDENAPKTIFGQLIDGVLHIADIKTQPPTELVPMQSTNWFDQEHTTAPQQEAQPQQEEYACENCGSVISEKVYGYSIDKFGIPLCVKCQRGAH